MSDHASSHSIIKDLKGTSDPPIPGGPSKISIAQQTWKSDSIYFPNKDEVLVEWILNSFSRQKGKHDQGTAIYSHAYWSLLSDILAEPSVQSGRIWLPSLLNRVSISSTVSSFLKDVPKEVIMNDILLVESFANCLTHLWPTSASRMNLDSLTDCFCSVLGFLSSLPSLQRCPEPMLETCLLVTRSLRHSLGTATNKKKASSAIGGENLPQWIKITASPPASGLEHRAENALRIEIYQIGIDVMFSLETLKSPNDPIIALLQRGFSTATPVSHISLIPRIFRSYLDETRRHRYGVFGSGSNKSLEQTVQNKVRDAGMAAFSMCYKTTREYGDKTDVWKSVLELLEVIDEAKIVGVASGVFSEIVLWSINALSAPVVPEGNATDDYHLEKVNTAIGILRVLLRIDMEVIGPLLRDILTGLLMINPSIMPNSINLLRDFLEFFSKTRNIMAYVSALMDTMSQANLMNIFPRHTDVQALHRLSILGSLLSIGHFEDLGRAVRGFLTPGQTQQCIDCVLEALRNAYENKYAVETPMDIDEPSQLKRANGKQEGRKDVKLDYVANISAISFSLSARTCSVILPCLPFNNLPPTVLTGVKTNINVFGDEIISEIIRTRLEASTLWRNQLVLTSTLRIRHSLVTSPSLQSTRICQERCTLRIFENKPQKGILPELIVEALRAFFDWDFSYSDNDDERAVIDFLMRYLTDNLTTTENSREIVENTMTMGWNGLSGTLDFSKTGGQHRAALSIWHLTLDRWLPLIDELASPLQLRMLSELIISLLSFDEHTAFTARLILGQTMRNAMFWELTNIRDALLSTAEKVMPVGSLDDFSKLANEIRGKSKKSRTQWEHRQIMTVTSVYELLLRAPKEYLSKAQRTSFFQRGLVADMAMYLSAKLDGSKQAYLRPRMMVRAWLGIISDTTDILELAHDWEFYFEFLFQANHCESGDDEAFMSTSSDLIGNTMKETIRDALRGNDMKLKRMCLLLQGEFKGGDPLYGYNLLRFVGILISEVPSNERQRLRSIEAIELIYRSLEVQSPTKLSLPVGNKAYRAHVLAIKTWRSYLALHKWLGKSNPIQRCGRELVASFVMCLNHEAESPEVSKYSSEVLLLLIDELYFAANEERMSHLELLAATYILLGRLDNSDMSVCDVELGHVSTTLPHSDFTLLFDLITDALRKGLNSSKETHCAIHLFQVLASNAPEGSSKIVQDHFEDCLQIFDGGNLFGVREPVTAFEALRLIRNQCSERPASVRSLSLGIIWLILSKCSTGSSSHTPHTHGRIFMAIVDIVGALIRLRRDLVQATLPHLVMVIRLLLSSLRSIRPQLGAKQTQLVSDTLPWWINSSEPLGVDEARAVGRLLTSLQTKTVPRTFKEKDKAEAQRAESLAHPFSKHAPYVLLAYIEAMNHPLCVLPLAVRRELEPGLFALCDMMSEHGRDAIMVSALDAGGKATLKALWREYEKQRYVGKG